MAKGRTKLFTTAPLSIVLVFTSQNGSGDARADAWVITGTRLAHDTGDGAQSRQISQTVAVGRQIEPSGAAAFARHYWVLPAVGPCGATPLLSLPPVLFICSTTDLHSRCGCMVAVDGASTTSETKQCESWSSSKRASSPSLACCRRTRLSGPANSALPGPPGLGRSSGLAGRAPSSLSGRCLRSTPI